MRTNRLDTEPPGFYGGKYPIRAKLWRLSHTWSVSKDNPVKLVTRGPTAIIVIEHQLEVILITATTTITDLIIQPEGRGISIGAYTGKYCCKYVCYAQSAEWMRLLHVLFLPRNKLSLTGRALRTLHFVLPCSGAKPVKGGRNGLRHLRRAVYL
jgi:hypothetical protein